MLKWCHFYCLVTPGVIDSKELLETDSIQSTREIDQWAGFHYLCKKILSDFLHQADIKSLNSAKSLNNLIPESHKLSFPTWQRLLIWVFPFDCVQPTRIQNQQEVCYKLKQRSKKTLLGSKRQAMNYFFCIHTIGTFGWLVVWNSYFCFLNSNK